ncbi:DUF421 domain-containing protein [Brevibacillus composti]|uniref:DUF421 domain-containing protein n=1 Tax=Brevibacillus composti TaxID=2796470 RepID=A0A7T5JMT8_9BACL|nr:DUF421 domain-containing protein [Brevibacillus composti]QQE73381.1 DUF421 domain-containing protein [Brevibacillus composti]QUO40462.1 DUF421 domain-containing protein [Brevibacillus composti]
MDWTLVWKAVGIILIGTLLLRIGGRKSIAQMTIAQVIVMIGIGTLLIQPISGHGYWTTLVLAAVLILMMILMEYAEMKVDGLETLISGKSVVVIENGQLHHTNMRKLRLTADKLEMRLRQAGIARIEDVEYATLEASGSLGYQLKPEKQPATKEDIQQLMKLLETRFPEHAAKPGAADDLFTELVRGHAAPPPQNLQ